MDVPILKRPMVPTAKMCCDYPVPGAQLHLSRRLIELAALDLIEVVGLEAFSTRKLAEKLRCKAMSIYHYFPSKDHLMDGLIDHLVAELLPMPPAHLPWYQRSRVIALSWRALALRRPKIFSFIATHRMNTTFALRYIDDVMGVMKKSGLGQEDSTRLFRSIGYYLIGAGIEEAAGYSRGGSTVEPVSPDVMTRDFPNVVAAAPYFMESEREKTFLAGLDILLEGWNARALAKAAEKSTILPAI